MQMDFHNPNDFWQGKDPLKGLNEDERIVTGALQVVFFALCFAVGLLICALLGSCTTTRYMPVTETRTEHHWHTDSVRDRDSTHTERETVIRELDSTAMSRYGIQMESNQRAWLVLQREMENRLRELEHKSAKSDTVRDSIPVPYTVKEYVERPVSVFEWVLRIAGGWALLALAVMVYSFFRISKGKQ